MIINEFVVKGFLMSDIIALSRVAREAAKKWFGAKKFIVWFTLFLGLVAIFIDKVLYFGIKVETLPKIEIGFAITAMISQAIGVVLLLRGLHLHYLSREGLRRGMLINSYGDTHERLDLSHLIQKFPRRFYDKAQNYNDNYYSSTREHGLLRLVDNLQESAFFSGNLFRHAAWRALLWLVTPAITILILSFALPYIKGNENFSLSRALLTIMVFFCASDSITECVNLFLASSKALKVDSRLGEADNSHEDTIIAAFADYFAATEISPIISTGLYEKYKDRLNGEWANRRRG